MKDSRRNFLKASCAAVVGAAAASGINLVNVKEAKAAPAAPGWGYVPLDERESKELGYYGYKGVSAYTSGSNKECASGVFTAIIGQLQDTGVNPAYDGIPLEMMRYGSGGVVGFASLCGALNGACAAINLICDESSAKAFIKDLLTWYSETPLPISSYSPSYNHIPTVADSNLCHVSVTKYCVANEVHSGSSQRSDRCACLCADVVGKVVEWLNANASPAAMTPGAKTVCYSCHYKSSADNYETGGFTRGEMNCLGCHTEIKSVSENGHHGGNQK